ncbi:hypothetical protein GCM10027445_47870 [Amycolatopsis endophytica]
MLVPFALLEMLAQVLCGLVMSVLRLIGVVRGRVDVVCRVPGEKIVPQPVLAVPGSGAAGHLSPRRCRTTWGRRGARSVRTGIRPSSLFCPGPAPTWCGTTASGAP